MTIHHLLRGVSGQKEGPRLAAHPTRVVPPLTTQYLGALRATDARRYSSHRTAASRGAVAHRRGGQSTVYVIPGGA
jgi:hypothetical protein